MAEARAGLQLGPAGLGYMSGPAGGWPTFDFRAGSVTLSAGAAARQMQVAVALAPPKGLVLTGSWLPYGGWNAAPALPLERSVAARGPAPAAGAAPSAGCLR